MESIDNVMNEEVTDNNTVRIKKEYPTHNRRGNIICVDINLEKTGENTLDGTFEYWIKGLDGNTYVSGKLYIEDNIVTDYDGVFSLPQDVMKALQDSGYDISQL